MFSLHRVLRGPDQSVRSLAVQAEDPLAKKQGTVFEILTRHLLERLVHNEALGEEIPTRITQLAYMFALPGVLMALYLFAAYHQPRLIGPRPFWLQISDHYVYTMYAFVVMGSVTVFEWDLLFPDLLDVFVLTSLPIPQRQLLAARLLALAIFLTLVLVGTNGLGTLFFPAVADLHGMWWHHVAAHFTAVAMAGAFSSALFIALQGILLCVCGRRVFAWISPLVQAASILAVLTVLFLAPLLCSHLDSLLNSGSLAVRLFPPFWFLGLYERLLWGAKALPVFMPLARTAVLATLGAIALVIFTYPLAYTRRTRQLVEGGESSSRRSGFGRLFHPILHRMLLRWPQQRAIYHFVGQTLFRTSRLRLYLSIYAGVGVSLAISGLLLLRVSEGRVHFGISSWGVWAVVPVLVFLAPIGLRTAFSAPVGVRGSWIFYVIHGGPIPEHLEGARRWVMLSVSVITVSAACGVYFVAPSEMRTAAALLTQLLMAVGLSVVLTDLFFLQVHHLPFTVTRTPSTTDLPVSFVRYAVVFPFFVLVAVARETGMVSSPGRLVRAVVVFVVLHLALDALRRFLARRHQESPVHSLEVSGRVLGLQE